MSTISGSRAPFGTDCRPWHARRLVPEDDRVLRADEIAHVERSDVVEHDRDDHLVGARSRLQHAGDAAPDETTDRTGDEQEGDEDDGGRVAEHGPGADPCGCGRPDEELAFGADVEQPGPEGESHRERRADEGCRARERRGDPVGVAPHAAKQGPVGLDRVVADGGDENAADEDGQDDGQERDEHRLEIEGLLELGCCAGFGIVGRRGGVVAHVADPPAIKSPSPSRFVSARSNSPARVPR